MTTSVVIRRMRQERGSVTLVELTLTSLLVGLVIYLAYAQFASSTQKLIRDDYCVVGSPDPIDGDWPTGPSTNCAVPAPPLVED